MTSEATLPTPQKPRRTPAKTAAAAADTASKKKGATFVVTLDDKKYTLVERELTARDTLAVRQQTGMPLAAFLSGEMDIDSIAVIVWLARRKTERNLTLDEVMGDLDYDEDRIHIAEQDGEASPEA